MILDKQNMFSEAQSVATTVGTVTSTNSIDLGAAQTTATGGAILADIARAGDLQVLCQVTTTVTSGGAATISAQLIQSANADLSSPTVLVQTPAIALATMIAGYQFRLAVPPGISQRYLGMQYVVAGATTTAGAVTSGIVETKQTTRI
jgi:hypothetical protein